MQRFEVFYGDTITRGTNWDAVVDGIIAVIVLHDNGAQEKVYGVDEYVLEDGKIVGYDGDSHEQARLGKLIPNEAYLRIIESLERRSTIWNL